MLLRVLSLACVALGGASALAVYSYKCADWEPVAGWKDLGLNDALLNKLGSDMSRSRWCSPRRTSRRRARCPPSGRSATGARSPTKSARSS